MGPVPLLDNRLLQNEVYNYPENVTCRFANQGKTRIVCLVFENDAFVAQSVEQLTLNQLVDGSNPPEGTRY